MQNEVWSSHNWLARKILNNNIHNKLWSFTGTIVDLGCGTRPYEYDILQYADLYIGVDWSNTLHGLHADIVANLNLELPIRTACVNHVVSFEVLEHLAEPDVMLHEAFRILKPDGKLTLLVPFQWWVHEAPWDYQRLTRYGLEHHLHKAGFTDIEVNPTTGFWSTWFLKLNYQLKRLPRGPRPFRALMTALLIPIWWLNQTIAPWLDKVWPGERETAGYFVTARKP